MLRNREPLNPDWESGMPSDTPLAGEPGSQRVGAGMGLGSPSQQKAVPPRSARHTVEEGLREIEGSVGVQHSPRHMQPLNTC